MRISIEETGLKKAGLGLSAIAYNARHLRPLAWKVRERWYESEQRAFAARKWAPRTASTLKRYRWPIRRWRKGGGGPMRTGRSKGRGVGSYSGAMQRVLTKPQQRGQKDTVVAGRGHLSLEVGVKARGPAAHANLFHRGVNGAAARLVVIFDRHASRDSAQDTVQHVLRRHR